MPRRKRSAATRAQTTSAKPNKSAFVRGLPNEMSAKDIVAKAKSRGMTMSIAYVYSVRTAAKAKALKGGANSPSGRPRGPGRPPGSASSGHATNARAEDLLRALAAELGLSHAITILRDQQQMVRAVIR